MTRIALILIAIVAIVAIGGAVFLSTWDIPPPTAHVEKVVPNERLPK
jgi:Flp pilus assembly protein CpaB